MAVPKKRKKLDEESIKTTKAEEELEQKQASPKKTVRASKPKEEKVNLAFQVMDKIDSGEESKAIEVQKVYPPPVEQGIHVRFKLDLVTLDDFVNMGNSQEKKENSIIIDFTIPYIWNLPIINEVLRTVITELKKMRIIK